MPGAIFTIEQKLSSALSYCCKIEERGFQAKLAREIGVPSGYISGAISCTRGFSEENRRKMVDAVIKLIPDFPAKTYDDFLGFGQWLLDGQEAKDWRSTRVRAATTLPILPGQALTKHTRPGTITVEAEGGAVVGGPVEYSTTKVYPGSSNVRPSPPIQMKIPVISLVQAGEWSEMNDPLHPWEAEKWINTTSTNHPNAFALVVQGDSMEPEFTEGDIITIDPGRAYENGSYVIVKNGTEATFKQLVIDGDSVYLKPLNGRYPIKDVTGIEFKIVGVVVEKTKKYY